MSNPKPPVLSLPSAKKAPPPPPPVAAAPALVVETAPPAARLTTLVEPTEPIASTPLPFADLLDKYPLPWVVGPYGDIWVAADVESYDPETVSGFEKIPGPNGTFWRTTEECRKRGKPRVVAEVSEVPSMHKDMAAFIVAAVNVLAK